MTRLALLADIHSDARSLRRALEQLAELDIALILCAGDAIDLGVPSGSDETIDLLEKAGAICIFGNHERWVLRDEHLRKRLSRASIGWLEQLPPSWSDRIDGVRVVMWHARPGSDMEAIDEDRLEPGEAEAILAEARADLLVVGHYHEPGVLRSEADVIVRPGALAIDTVEGPWVFDREKGRFVQGQRERGTFAVVELPAVVAEIVEVTGARR